MKVEPSISRELKTSRPLTSSERTLLLRDLAMAVFVVLAALLVAALAVSGFVPSPVVVRISQLVAMALGLCSGVWAWTARPARPSIRRPMMSLMGKLMSFPYVRAPFAALLTFLIAWPALYLPIPAAINAAIGSRGSVPAIVDYLPRRYGCVSPGLEHVPMLGKRWFCLDRNQSIAPGDQVLLEGKTSAFGVQVQRIVRSP